MWDETTHATDDNSDTTNSLSKNDSENTTLPCDSNTTNSRIDLRLLLSTDQFVAVSLFSCV